MMELRVRTRHTILHCSTLVGTVASSPVVNRAAEPRSVKRYCKNVEGSSNKEGDASDRWEGIHGVAYHLGGEHKLKNTQPDQTTFKLEAGNPGLEKASGEACLGEKKDYNFNSIESDNEECSIGSRILVRNTGILIRCSRIARDSHQ